MGTYLLTIIWVHIIMRLTNKSRPLEKRGRKYERKRI